MPFVAEFPFADDNFATLNGGGIYCDDCGIIEWKDASINYNTTASGGGLFLDDCTLTMAALLAMISGQLKSAAIISDTTL